MAEQKKSTIRLSKKAAEAVRQSAQALADNGYPELARSVQKILQDVSRDRFTVAVVGEFSRGKSTFLNRLLEMDALPVGNMPTTAMLTRIRNTAEPMLVHLDEKGVRQKSLPLTQEAWEGLVADNFGGSDPKGTVFAGVPQPWLAKMNLELMDTPGAGDLEEGRARLIGEALLSADGAVITISATQAMSLSEKLFIEQRLIARKTPFLLLVITKMDQIPESQRGQMVEFVKSKLAQWGMDIPVYIPYDVAMPEQYRSIVGMDKVKKQIESWVNDPKRVALTDKWVLARVDALLSAAQDSSSEEQRLASADRQKRDELLGEKRLMLEKAQGRWEELLLQMRSRSNRTYDLIQKRVAKYQGTITERLQYEASHAAHPERWWNDDMPYRLKVELTNMASNVENLLSKAIADDVRWFNGSLEKSFKTSVGVPQDTLSDGEPLDLVATPGKVELQDIDKQRSMTRLATSAVSILGAVSLSCLGLGFLSIVATMGVGTGASLVTDKLFKGKVEQQRAQLKEQIGKQIPGIVQDAVKDSQAKIRNVYGEIIKAAEDKQTSWMDAQRTALEKSVKAADAMDAQAAAARAQTFARLRQTLADNAT